MVQSDNKPHPDPFARFMGFLFDLFARKNRNPEFKRIHAAGVRSLEGFFFEYVDRSSVRYWDGKKVLTISREIGFPDVIYFTGTDSWDGTQEKITSSEKAVIKERIQRALDYLNADDIIV